METSSRAASLRVSSALTSVWVGMGRGRERKELEEGGAFRSSGGTVARWAWSRGG